jgi:hypothetical protein
VAVLGSCSISGATIRRTGSLLAIVAALAAPANGQDYFARLGGPFARVLVLNAPFSAEATTRIQELFPDGTTRLHTVIARYYRDSHGRVRAEVDTPWGPYVVVATPGPEHVESYVLDPTTRTYRSGGLGYGWAAQLFNGEGGVPLPVGKACFQYPSRIPLGASDAERLQAVNAQVSPDLGIVTASHRADEIVTVDSKATNIRRVVDYELTNIRREEPPAQLFQLPTDYTADTFVSIGSGDNRLVGFAPWQSPPACKPLKR